MFNMPLKRLVAQSNLKLPPALWGLLIQVVALLIVVLSVMVGSSLSTVRFSFLSLIVMQAIVAVLICSVTSMAIWWRWIHGFFPLAMYSMSLLTLPNELYLFGFLITLGMFWTTFNSQVPFFPSRPIIREKIAALIPQNQPSRMIDIGSGLGDLSMHIAQCRPLSQVEGIEIAPMPWMFSVMRAWFKQSTAHFKLGDYHSLDFGQYDFVFAYLSPAAMPALWEKAHQEMQAGSLLISYEFNIPESPASFIIQGDHPTIYVWEM